ncbi:hypothetical protein QFZ65_002249 [Arthrobacter sp. B3I9]|nr:hypothetical protein [Arthrobacter sp. B3I9]
MPHSTIRLTPSARRASRSARISPTSGCETVAASTQPSRTEASASASGPQRVGVLGEDPGGDLIFQQCREVLFVGLPGSARGVVAERRHLG